MAYRDRLPEQSIIRMTYDGPNLYGRLTIDGMRDKVGVRRARRASRFNASLYHRAKNGVYDPITYFHIMDVLCRIEPGQEFRTSDLMEVLRATKPDIIWDPTTVGRVVADIVESLNEQHGFTVIHGTRRWNGSVYIINAVAEGRHAMVDLLDDLVLISEDVLARESLGEVVKRSDSPLLACGSLGMV